MVGTLKYYHRWHPPPPPIYSSNYSHKLSILGICNKSSFTIRWHKDITSMGDANLESRFVKVVNIVRLYPPLNRTTLEVFKVCIDILLYMGLPTLCRNRF